MKQILLAGLLGAVATMGWGMLAWVVLPIQNAALKPLPDEPAVVGGLRTAAVPSGAYVFPAMPQGNDARDETKWHAFEMRHIQGPVGLLFIRAEGSEPMKPSLYVSGLLIAFLGSLLAAWLLSICAHELELYWQRVGFVTALGVFAALVSHVTQWNWLYMPGTYTALMAFDVIMGRFIVGMVIAAIVTPD